jgi:hypothetical protein
MKNLNHYNKLKSMSLKQQLTFDNNNRYAYKFLIKSDLLLGSYGKIKSKPGTITLDGISIKYVENLHKSLKDESWLPKQSIHRKI